MAQLYSQDIKNFVSGISQQPPKLRYPEQLEHQENAFSTESSGLQKRPPTILVKNLGHILKTNVKPFVHMIDRDKQEKYFVIFTGDDVVIYSLDGSKMTLKFDGDTKKYLQVTSPRRELAVQTVADYSFVVNKNKNVQMSAKVSEDKWTTQGALVNIKSGQWGRTYTISVNGHQVATHSTPDGTAQADTPKIDTNYIRDRLAEALKKSGATVQTGESWVYFTMSYQITNMETKDGFNGKAMQGFLTTCQKYTDLPASAPNGFTIKVNGDPASDSDDYYISYHTSKAVWEETAKPAQQNDLALSTMPHTLIREEDGTFSLKQATWEPRTIGDEDSNPLPSFVGKPIQDVFFYRSRIGFLSTENIILTQSTNLFNFWMTSASGVIDTDPIDISANHPEKAVTLNYAVPVAEDLVLFSDRAQFAFGSDGALTPTSARAVLATDYPMQSYASPVSAGRNVYFASERLEYSSVHEFYTMENISEGKAAEDITNYVPSFIPNRIHRFLPGASENVILALTEGAPNQIFVYKYLFSNDSKRQSSWSYWSFDDDAEILGGGFVGSTLYLLIQRPNGVTIEKVLFSYNTKDLPEEPFRAYLDSKMISPPIPNENYDEYRDRTLIPFSTYYKDFSALRSGLALVAHTGSYLELDNEEIKAGQVYLIGDYRGKQITLGYRYNWKIILSELMLKKLDDSGGVKAMHVDRLQLRRGWVNYVDTGYFKVTVEYKGRGMSSVTEMIARHLGVNAMTDVIPNKSGEFRFGITSKSTACRIILENDTAFPTALVGGGWEGTIFSRSRAL